MLVGPATLPAPAAEIELRPRPDAAWLTAWGAAEGRDPRDAGVHADTVLAQLDGRATYAISAAGDAVGSASPGTGCAACSASPPAYARLGFTRRYDYLHRVAPAP